MNDNTAFNQEWVKMQRAFWAKSEHNSKPQAKAFNEWLDNLEVWWKEQSQESPKSVSPLYQKLLNNSRFFLTFAEPFLDAEQENKTAASVLVNYLEPFLAAINDDNEENQAYIKGFWKLPFDLWRQQVGFVGNLPDSFKRFVDVSPEQNGNNKELLEAHQKHLDALEKYQSAYVAMSLEAATQLMEQLRANEDSEQSIQEMFALWVALFEAHYGEFVRDDAYSLLYADVVNSWMTLSKQASIVIKPWLKAINMPVSEDIEVLKAKQATLRDENESLKKNIEKLKGSR